MGIAGVKVSDGYNIVITDSRGRFTLSGWNKARFITVYQPADYTCSQWFIPVEKDKSQFSFALQSTKKKDDVSFVHIADTETFQFGDWLLNLKEYGNKQRTLEVTPLLLGDKLFFGASDGNLYLVDKEEGKLKWKKSLGAPVLMCVIIPDLIIADQL